MKKIINLSLFVFIYLATNSFAFSHSDNKDYSVFISDEQNSSFAFTMISGSWKENLPANTEIHAYIQFKTNNEWTKWLSLEREGEDGNIETMAITNPATSFKYKFEMKNDGASIPFVSNVKWTLINSSSRLNASSNVQKSSTIVSRKDWGANETLRYLSNNNPTNTVVVPIEDDYFERFKEELTFKRVIRTDEKGERYTWPLQYPQNVSKFIIHHTATVNNLNNPSQAIRDIYYYHSVTRGWGDIGYNYIIDTNGTIYEGRFGGEGVVGAHAGKSNTGSIGIAVLGNYEENAVPQKVVEAISFLISEKATFHSIDPIGKSRFRGILSNNILGHKDVMATACPGKTLYALLPQIAQMASSNMKSSPKKLNIDYWYNDISDFKVLELDTDQSKEFTIRLQNAGNKSWEEGSYILYEQNPRVEQLAEFPDKNGVVLARMNEKQVKPGQIATFTFKVLPKNLISSTTMSFHLMVDGKRKIEQGIIKTLSNVQKGYDYELVSMTNIPDKMIRNQRQNITLKLKNTGGLTWYNSGINSVKIGTDNPKDRKSSFTRPPRNRLANLEESVVKPGEIGTFKFTIIAPIKSGIYRQYIAPVVEEKTWMPSKDLFFETMVVSSLSQSIVDKKPENPTIISNTDENIRIKLSVFKMETAVVTSNKDFETYKGTQKLRDFKAGDRVEITEAGIRVVAKNGGILEIVNLENRPAWNNSLNDNKYRGVLEFSNENGKLIVINELALEDYIKGLGEVSNGEHEEKIKTIIIAARTYALYYMKLDQKFPGKNYHLDDDPNASQRYLGYNFEQRAGKVVKAVEDTKGQVITYQGKLIKTPYFSSTDGIRTLSAEEKWGWKDTPYLLSVSDAHCTSTSFNGHGVGISGCGASVLAERGYDYLSIIKYYYSGVEITKI